MEIAIYLTPCSGKQLAQEKAEDSFCSEFYRHIMHNLNVYGEDYEGSLVRGGRFGFFPQTGVPRCKMAHDLPLPCWVWSISQTLKRC